MFYTWVKRALLLSVAITACFVIALSMGWVGLENTVFIIRLTLITTGLFVFYHTRNKKSNPGWIQLPVMVVHFLSLPLAIFMVWMLGNEQMTHGYWFMVNLAMVLALGITWLVLLMALPLPGFIRVLVTMLSGVYLVLLCVHMCGYFDNGKVIFFGGTLIFFATALLVFFAIKKKRPAPVNHEHSQAPVSE